MDCEYLGAVVVSGMCYSDVAAVSACEWQTVDTTRSAPVSDDRAPTDDR
ncbi:hypothetical protein GCM10010399_79620 [Dactylosporangium fulvum]